MTSRRRFTYATRSSKAFYVFVKSHIRRLYPVFVQSHLRLLDGNRGFTLVRSHNRYRYEIQVKSHSRCITPKYSIKNHKNPKDLTAD